MNMKVFSFCLAAALLPHGGAKAATIYSWQADCTLGCTGKASGTFTIGNGAFGNFQTADFIAFEYRSSSGTFTLLNASPFLTASSGGLNGPLFLEENAFFPGPGPNTLPLFQFVHFPSPQPGLTQSTEPNIWQLLVGEYGWTCLDPACSSWTNNVTRNVGVNFTITGVRSVPEPATWAMMLVGFGLAGSAMRRRHLSRLKGSAVSHAHG